MVRRVVGVALILVLVTSLWPGRAGAQWEGMAAMMGGGPTVSGAGSVVVSRQPDKVRMFIELTGKGKTLEEALARLKDRREAAALQLEALKADKDSIDVSDPSVSSGGDEQKEQLERMIRMQMMGRRRTVPKALKTARSITVSATLSAEWPLEESTVEKTLVATEALKEKVKAANLSGTDEPEELSPEEEELAEEMEQMMMESGQEQVEEGTPHFFYVATISEEDRDLALAKAFRKAKTQAARLAQAAGIRLGKLVGLSGDTGDVNQYGFNPYNDYMSSWGGNYQQQEYVQRILARGFSDDAETRRNEAVGSEPGSLKFTVNVHAAFTVEE